MTEMEKPLVDSTEVWTSNGHLEKPFPVPYRKIPLWITFSRIFELYFIIVDSASDQDVKLHRQSFV